MTVNGLPVLRLSDSFLSISMFVHLLDTAFHLDNDMHLLFGNSDSLGPSPCWDLSLVQLVNLSCGTTMQS